MYVCVCKAVTDHQIRKAIDNGVRTRRQLHHCLGVGGECGKCNKQVKELLDGARQQQSIMQQSSLHPILTAC
ncbi:(2Fe-2S)-binding protein [Methylosarcina fibrata]|uniref:(2Fe-2S)-binding protein n=1 Tax=Methylosarcina fibrata TaxID=105972 RepID=UPI0003A0E895|nr:(2Fe-2S)-binding protein [Methylosarcina fibrata]